MATTLFKHSYFVYLIHSKWLRDCKQLPFQQSGMLGKGSSCLPGSKQHLDFPAQPELLPHVCIDHSSHFFPAPFPLSQLVGQPADFKHLLTEAVRWGQPSGNVATASSWSLLTSSCCWRPRGKPLEYHYGSDRCQIFWKHWVSITKKYIYNNNP